MEVYIKVMKEKEFLFTSIASDAGISPMILFYEKDGEDYIVSSQKYPKCLIDEPVWADYKEEAIRMIRGLHFLNIFHSDITEENFVVNPITKEIKLIDYGLSCWISSITEMQMKSTYEPAQTIEELLEIEVKQVEWLFNQK